MKGSIADPRERESFLVRGKVSSVDPPSDTVFGPSKFS